MNYDGNVAFKCIYNDGGAKDFVGFSGTCSDGNILRNVRTKRPWCSNPGNKPDCCINFHLSMRFTTQYTGYFGQ